MIVTQDEIEQQNKTTQADYHCAFAGAVLTIVHH